MRILNAALIVLLLLVVGVRVFSGDVVASPDSPRYIAMGLNLSEHGVLTGDGYQPQVVPKPGLGQGGAYTAVEIAVAAAAHEETKNSLICHIDKTAEQSCDMKITALQVIYALEMYLFHLCIFLIARTVLGNDIKAWLAVAVSLGFKETRLYVASILSEPAYFMALGIFLLCWLKAFRQSERLPAWLLCGVALGLVTLVKPAWNALLPALGMLAVLAVLFRREIAMGTFRAALGLGVGVVLVTAPLFIRNVVQLDVWGFSDPDYLVVSLAHRFSFNAMSWGEWLSGWLYFVPDFGDRAAAALLGKAMVAKLDWSPDSYYAYGRDVLHELAMSQGGAEGAKAFLLENHFLNDPIKSLAVTALLAWRGVFVGNLMGFAAVLLALPVLRFSTSQIRRDILVLSVPLVVMVGVHALVSVSLHRYNIGLIVPFSLIIAQVVYAIGYWGYDRMAAFRKVEGKKHN